MQKGDPLPDRIGPYRVQRQLSATGSALVYLAREEGPMGFARDVVLKLVLNPSADDAEAVKEVGREATICARLNHPGIVRTYHFFEHPGALCLVLEYVDGIPLTDLLAASAARADPLSDDVAFHVGISILDALAHAHAMVDEKGTSTPVVHRAVTPSHVMLGRDGTVKLSGFGFAKILEGSADTKTSLKWEPTYMAPEQATEEKVTPRWDVYAAGLILWELLSGRSSLALPAQPLAIRETLRLVAERKLESLAELRRDLPREVSAAVDAALVSSPAKRTIGCAEMAQWIRKSVPVGRGKKELHDLVGAELRASTAPGTPVETPPAVQPGAPRAARQREPTLLGIAPPAPPPPAPETPPPSSATRGRTLRPGPASAAAPPRALPPPVVTGRVPRPPGNAAAAAAPRPVAAAAAAPVAAAAGTDHVADAKPPIDVPPPPLGMQAVLASVIPPAAPPPAATPPVVPPGGARNVDAFAETMAAGEPAPAPSYSVPPPRGLRSGPPVDYRNASFIDRLKAPTPYRRRPWLFAWMTLGVLGLGLLTWRLAKVPSITSPSPTPEASSEDPAIAPRPSEPLPALPASATPSPLPAPTPPVGSAETADTSRLPRGFGYLTVHSSSPVANVYVQMTKYGRVEDVLAVPCGKRLVSLGIGTRKRRDPVWLAPGKIMNIPCGGLLETTIEPRKVR